MQALYDALYQPGIPLKIMGLIVGGWLIASHLFALIKPGIVKPFLRKYPRNDNFGVVLVIIGFAWSFMIWTCMDLGEFFTVERPVQYIIVLGCIGVIVYVREFIAVRSLGFIMILAAAPILVSAFLKEPQTRLLIVAFAYVIAVKGMFWIGIPYWMRDQINWVLAEDKRYKIGALAGLAYGILIVVCAILWW